MKATKLIFLLALFLLTITEVSSQEKLPSGVHLQKTQGVATITAEESQRRFQDAIALFEMGKTNAAIYALQQLEKADPTNYEIFFKLGEMAIAEKNWAYSIEVLQKASVLRPNDIEVRLILMDIYKAYQMPIQEIIAGREILKINPNHVGAIKLLAGLYEEQSMEEEEITTRRELMRLVPDDFDNLKRLAYILNGSGVFWEAVRVYEQIRKYHPDKIEDINRLAALYGKTQEYFRQLDVLEQSKGGGWMRGSAGKNQRLMLQIYDPLVSKVTFRSESSDDIDILTVNSIVGFEHIRIRSSIDIGFQAKYSLLSHSGQDDLDGIMNINSSTFSLSATKNWRHQDYQLTATLGALGDHISGNLFPRDPSSDIDQEDFPFLEDPNFNIFKGGFRPVGGLRFIARPSLYSTYLWTYNHDLLDDLDARLRLFYYDKMALAYKHQSDNLTEFGLTVDASRISDGNIRLYSAGELGYTIWGSGAMRDYRGKRKSFFNNPPFTYLAVAYALEYFSDQDSSRFHETYKNEIQHEGRLLAQTRIATIGLERYFFVNAEFSYSIGKDINSNLQLALGIFYSDYGTNNFFGLTYGYGQEDIDLKSQQNQLFAGDFTSHTVSLMYKWRF